MTSGRQARLAIAWLIVGCLHGTVRGQVTPTFEWVNFYGTISTLNGALLPVGTRVEARDPDSVLCGECAVSNPGSYGFLPVYRDDPYTPEVDEGAMSGDTIRFFINDMPALAVGPDSPVWTSNGDAQHVELEASATTAVSDRGSGFGIPSTPHLTAFPNPTSGRVTIQMSFPMRGFLQITIYDVRGRNVTSLDHKLFSGLMSTVTWDGCSRDGDTVPPGVYFIHARLQGPEAMPATSTKILVLY